MEESMTKTSRRVHIKNYTCNYWEDCKYIIFSKILIVDNSFLCLISQQCHDLFVEAIETNEYGGHVHGI